MAIHRFCDGVRRRDFLRAGVVGASGMGLGLANYLRLSAAGEVQPTAKAKRAIFIYLGGGPTHIDSFDMKPKAPAEIRGEFNPIATNVNGIQICEHLPNLAKCTDKYTILRGVTHTLAAHELGTKYLLTGNRPVPSLFYPTYGSVVSREVSGPSDLPSFVAVPGISQGAGYLGVQYAPLQTSSTPKLGEPYSVRGIALQEGVTVTDLEKRHALLKQLDKTFASVEQNNKLISGLNRFEAQAHDIITSPRARQAFNTGLESPQIAERFGASGLGQSCLLAVRLVEAGVPFVTCSVTGWDTHGGNFKACQTNLLPALDQSLAGTLTTLEERGLLDSTIVYVTGEFGRTPKINPRAGRDHWPRAMFVIMAGGGVRNGQVIGESDATASEPASEGFTPDQVAASFYHALGIDFHKEYHTNTGRPVMIVRHGSVIPGLFG